jgi:hypothetical protein
MIILLSILFAVHVLGVVDVKVWTREKPLIREKYNWLLNDWMYLGGTVLLFIATVIIVDISDLPTIDKLRHTAIGLLLGSVVGDCIFGFVLYSAPFHPFKDWFSGWGFKTQRGRYIFDGARIAGGIILCFFQIT